MFFRKGFETGICRFTSATSSQVKFYWIYYYFNVRLFSVRLTGNWLFFASKNWFVLLLGSYFLAFISFKFQLTMSASTTIHDSIFTNVMRSPMSFFDSNPPGRIMNKFSKELDEGEVSKYLSYKIFNNNPYIRLQKSVINRISWSRKYSYEYKLNWQAYLKLQNS